MLRSRSKSRGQFLHGFLRDRSQDSARRANARAHAWTRRASQGAIAWTWCNAPSQDGETMTPIARLPRVWVLLLGALALGAAILLLYIDSRGAMATILELTLTLSVAALAGSGLISAWQRAQWHRQTQRMR